MKLPANWEEYIEDKLLEKIKEILSEGYHAGDDENTPYIFLEEIKEILNDTH